MLKNRSMGKSLKESGISDEDRMKIFALNQFILKGEKSWRSVSQKDSLIPETSQLISLKDLGVTPYTIFLNPPNFSVAPFYMVNNTVFSFTLMNRYLKTLTLILVKQKVIRALKEISQLVSLYPS